jgi:phosphoglycolate phosphatase
MKIKDYKYIAFDLDGTLTDPESGLTSGFAYALSKMGISYGDKTDLSRFIGPPLKAEFRAVYGMSDAEAEECIRLFREYFSVYGWWDNRLYDGVPQMLSALKSAGKTLLLATSKPDVFANKILRLFDIAKYFDFVGAATLDHTRVEKSEVLRYALESVGADFNSAILVGDRVYDAEGARTCGIDSLGVLYGHGSLEEIKSSGFTYAAESVSDIAKILI